MVFHPTLWSQSLLLSGPVIGAVLCSQVKLVQNPQTVLLLVLKPSLMLDSIMLCVFDWMKKTFQRLCSANVLSLS